MPMLTVTGAVSSPNSGKASILRPNTLSQDLRALAFGL